MSKYNSIPNLGYIAIILVLAGCHSNSETYSNATDNKDLPPTSIVVDSSLYEIVIAPTSLTYIPMVKLSTQTNYQAIGKYSDGTEVDITDEVDWSITSSDIADIHSGHISPKNEGSTRVIAKLDGIVSDEANLTVTASSVCNHDVNLPLDDASIIPGGGINDVNIDAAGGCLKIASATVAGKTLLFTSTPSVAVLQRLGYKQSMGIDSANDGRNYSATVQDSAYGEAFGLFDQRNIAGSHGINGQYDRWCTDLARMKFAGKTDWKTATIAEIGSHDASKNPALEGLFQDKGDMATLGWPTDAPYWSNTQSASPSNYDTMLLSNGSTFSGGASYTSYVSCVSEGE
ncbi:DUF1566 domain-containing protein [Vibrio sp. DW001]|uniref:hypothetical protein n=1 Tax=Vibrio sp. DW001 TaxID=2912315 RepID=UPI0023B1BA6A|nr:hypothetical protein [Vibrio sp. DW001]WED27752.1 DUF1566 domain-containing protein [Vibrio sp. DW001]